MNTKTMRLPPRRVLTSNKRKEREGFDSLKPSPPSPPTTKIPKPNAPEAGSGNLAEPISSNQLLAGYLAYEYLTKGTLYGQPWERAGAEPVVGMESKNVEPNQEVEEAEPNKGNYQTYMEVSSLLKADGAHLPGVVNPSQLSRVLKM
ncbi:hypothetical protein JCGZ_17658 [Jatropha curcas]|uniref:Uncharacterized protein n=1 Tax=Jatropha curcas TaxID=180498 RepID=A0A067K2K6_JATCU|nr:uncharacterized protein LOC105644507 [Jatropha curcas]KDP26500.1 hypothetical protein JCGZ_17658 [Jatropha curcas]